MSVHTARVCGQLVGRGKNLVASEISSGRTCAAVGEEFTVVALNTRVSTAVNTGLKMTRNLKADRGSWSKDKLASPPVP